jgi:hypothetical protein
MKIRSKIAFSAFIKRLTINELIVKTCYQSYNLFLKTGVHKNIYNVENLNKFRELITSENKNILKTALVMRENVM